MQYTQAPFSFSVSTLPKDTFHVVRFAGEEGLSTLYRFEITLISQNLSVDFDKALEGAAALRIAAQGDLPERVWHGVLTDFRQKHRTGGHAFYTAVLAPRAERLNRSRGSRIFLNQDIPATLTECLAASGLIKGQDFEVVTSRSYPKREYVCQYNETPYHFLSRWAERNGLYWFFDQSQGCDRLVLTETLTTHPPLPGSEQLTHTEPSGLEAPLTGSAVHGLRAHKRRLPREVLLTDYNYRTPNLEIAAKALVSRSGEGVAHVHGGNIRTLSEAKLLAHARAQEIACRGLVFSGESNAAHLAPGYLFTLSNHYRDDFNQRFLATLVRHEGSQEGWLTSGVATRGLGDELFYRNAFTAIPATVQYRSECRAEWPVIAGSMSAFIDAEGGGEQPVLDSQGRYKVVLPFDLSGRKGGKASAWIRMAQPYAGENSGMHFPLRKGTEVLLGFVNGNPDMPVITAAVPNPATPSPVRDENQTMNAITTASGNHFHMEDKAGKERILMHCRKEGSFLRIGQPNDPPTDIDTSDGTFSVKNVNYASNGKISTVSGAWTAPAPAPASDTNASWGDQGGVTWVTPGAYNVKAATANSLILGENTQWNVGGYACNTLGLCVTMNAISSLTFNLGFHADFAPYWKEIYFTKSRAAAKEDAIIADLNSIIGKSTKILDIDSNIASAKLSISDTEKHIGELRSSITVTSDKVNKAETSITATRNMVIQTGQYMIDELTNVSNTCDQLAVSIRSVSTNVEDVANDVRHIHNSRFTAAVTSVRTHENTTIVSGNLTIV
ncbi:Actin cross-linking toxin VgrG1 [Fundidesulfovibrio magnetotacticus]|uniref:Actin cross-linking toxin VgrG1 n=1 Tax=Fundidesulfovibrio magnetotacticus TaxID=2730080 RepID=A0A6V8LTH6_9BACT|nr:type VI secretion system tip protein TssI/VgrG [Fundidesulfovibrio magnetotacticus]GFK95772.1 Actin cross-linking toxin VgrG1 [Fundidesulfovibrio magnetotacticus]